MTKWRMGHGNGLVDWWWNGQRERKLGMLLERQDEWPDGRPQRSERAIVKMVVDGGPAQVPVVHTTVLSTRY